MSHIDPIGTTFDRSQRREAAKALRKTIPLESHGDWQPAENRADPVSLLQAQDKSRLQHLVPIKYGRMLVSPFAYLRGSALVMASDLVDTPVTGFNAQLCGDAHISNFGLFASLERKLIFDVNDFDESILGPWEWDLKRLAASAVVAARGNNFSDKACRRMAYTAADTYRAAMREFAKMGNLEVWYYETSIDVLQNLLSQMSSKKFIKQGKKLVKKARSRTQWGAVKKLTRLVDGHRQIIHQPPLIESLRETKLAGLLTAGEEGEVTVQTVMDAWDQYLDSLPAYRRIVLSHFRIADAALRVGGVGSVGTRCFIILLESDTDKEALILQLKEAGPSSLAPYLGHGAEGRFGEQVVTAQRLVQASSDAFLGWHTSKLTGVDYYWRQFKDMKGSAKVENMDANTLQTYVAVCSGCLARAHARTGDASSISGYLGKKKPAFPEAITRFAEAYADQTQRDYDTLVDAEKSGRITAQKGI